jgi:hypothetical protein
MSIEAITANQLSRTDLMANFRFIIKIKKKSIKKTLLTRKNAPTP